MQLDKRQLVWVDVVGNGVVAESGFSECRAFPKDVIGCLNGDVAQWAYVGIGVSELV